MCLHERCERHPSINKPACPHCFDFDFESGDVLLFDYQVKHRGDTNRSPDLRSLLYLTYARKWYKDTNFAPRAWM